jgi:hypothetical protein
MEERVVFWGIFGIITAGILAGAACLFNCARSDGRIDYCRVIYYNENNVQLPVYIVEGHRPWRPDVRVAITTNADDAEAKRKALCPQ